MPRRFAPLALVCVSAVLTSGPARGQENRQADEGESIPDAGDEDSTGTTRTDDGEEIIERTPATGPDAGLGLEGIPERAGDERRVPGRVRTEFAEVMAGPGAAYIGRGRVYQNDRVQILRRNEAGDWLEVESNGLRGWVRARYLEVLRDADARRPDGAIDAGRDRRRTNYGYDNRGRRLRPDGTPFGSPRCQPLRQKTTRPPRCQPLRQQKMTRPPRCRALRQKTTRPPRCRALRPRGGSRPIS
jgi:hypothetical protein